MPKAKPSKRKAAEPLVPLQINLTKSQLDQIDQARELSGLRFRTEFIVQSAVMAARKKLAEK